MTEKEEEEKRRRRLMSYKTMEVEELIINRAMYLDDALIIDAILQVKKDRQIQERMTWMKELEHQERMKELERQGKELELKIELVKASRKSGGGEGTGKSYSRKYLA